MNSDPRAQDTLHQLPLGQHPADDWQQQAGNPDREGQRRHRNLMRLRLAAMAGHMRGDLVTTRRAALIDLLRDNYAHPREAIWEAVEKQLGRPCWGKRPEETLLRDLRALRRGGLRIAYSRRPGATGYYLQEPPLERPVPAFPKAINWGQIKAIRRMSVDEKNRMAFEAAEFALSQKRLLLAEENPDWPEEQVTAEARRLVYGSRSGAAAR